MRPRPLGFARVLALAASVATVAGGGAGAVSPPALEWRELSEGVRLASAPDAAPGGLNALIVEREDGLLVVDTLGDPVRAGVLLRALASSGGKPVRYLVLSHPHADAVGGASAFPESVLVVAARGFVDAIEDPETDLGGEARRRAENPASWVPFPGRRPILLISGPTALDDPKQPVELFVPAFGHSRGDLVVRLPNSGILAVGDLLAGDRNPFAADGDCAGWLAALNDLARTRPTRVVPLRGDPTDQRGLLVQRDAFAWLRGRIDQAYVDLVPSAQIPDRILADPELAAHFDLEARPSFVPSIVECTLESARRDRRKRGYPD